MNNSVPYPLLFSYHDLDLLKSHTTPTIGTSPSIAGNGEATDQHQNIVICGGLAGIMEV